MFPENRDHRRHPCRVRFLAASRSAVTGEVRDLSPTGMCLVTDTTFARGMALHLEFELGGATVDVVGEVRRVVDLPDGQVEVGIKFVRIPAQSLAVIKAAVEEKPFVSSAMRDFVYR